MSANRPVKSGDLFFFYGTLKQGAGGAPGHLLLDQRGTFIGPALIRGDLYDLGDYPGALEGQGVVHGTLYRLDDLQLVPLLDDYEGVIENESNASLYLRRLTPLLDRNLVPTGKLAWVYWYNQPVHTRRQIESGIWTV